MCGRLDGTEDETRDEIKSGLGIEDRCGGQMLEMSGWGGGGSPARPASPGPLGEGKI